GGGVAAGGGGGGGAGGWGWGRRGAGRGPAGAALGGSFPAKPPPAVTGHPAVSVDDDLSPRETRVPVRSADHESAGGVDEKSGPAVVESDAVKDRLDDLFDDSLADGALRELA